MLREAVAAILSELLQMVVVKLAITSMLAYARISMCRYMYVYLHINTYKYTWASPENPMWMFLYKTTTIGLKDLPRKVAMVLTKGTLDFAKDVS